MTVTTTGNYPYIQRRESLLPSLDFALSNFATHAYGFPIRTIWEIYGRPEVGKTSLAQYIAGRAYSKGKIELIALDSADRDYARTSVEMSGFDGEVHFVDHQDEKGEKRKHEEMLAEALDSLEANDDTVAMILDNIGVLAPVVERKGDFDEVFMGKRAQLVAKFGRRALSVLREAEKPKLIICLNHALSAMGGGFQGTITPGGDSLKYDAAVRLQVWADRRLDGGMISNGKATKNRYGGEGKQFQFAILAGRGVHSGLSAVADAVELGLAEKSSKVVEDSTTIKFGGKNLGRMSTLLQRASDGKNDIFTPVFEAVRAHYKKLVEAETEVIPPVVTEKGSRRGKAKK